MKLQKDDGIKPEDVIAIYTDNHKNSCIPFIASQFLGAIPCHCDFKSSSEIDVYLLKLIEPKVVISNLEKAEKIKKCLQQAQLKAKLIIFEDTEDYLKFSDYLTPQEKENEFTPFHVNNNDTTAVIVFTSGTTG